MPAPPPARCDTPGGRRGERPATSPAPTIDPADVPTMASTRRKSTPAASSMPASTPVIHASPPVPPAASTRTSGRRKGSSDIARTLEGRGSDHGERDPRRRAGGGLRGDAVPPAAEPAHELVRHPADDVAGAARDGPRSQRARLLPAHALHADADGARHVEREAHDRHAAASSRPAVAPAVQQDRELQRGHPG